MNKKERHNYVLDQVGFEPNREHLSSNQKVVSSNPSWPKATGDISFSLFINIHNLAVQNTLII